MRPLFLEDYVELTSDERIQEYDESFCGAYCLYLIYLFDRGFRTKSALNVFINQVKYHGMRDKCLCLSCSKDYNNDNVNVNDNVNDNGNVNVNVNDNDIVNDNDNVNDNDDVNDN